MRLVACDDVADFVGKWTCVSYEGGNGEGAQLYIEDSGVWTTDVQFFPPEVPLNELKAEMLGTPFGETEADLPRLITPPNEDFLQIEEQIQAMGALPKPWPRDLENGCFMKMWERDPPSEQLRLAYFYKVTNSVYFDSSKCWRATNTSRALSGPSMQKEMCHILQDEEDGTRMCHEAKCDEGGAVPGSCPFLYSICVEGVMKDKPFTSWFQWNRGGEETCRWILEEGVKVDNGCGGRGDLCPPASPSLFGR